MQTLKLSREFPITLTFGQALKLKELGLLDLAEVGSLWDQLKFIFTDFSLMARLLWEMTDQSRWSFEAFCEMLPGVKSQAIEEAVTNAIVSYFPPAKRLLIQGIFKSVLAARSAAERRMLDLLKESEQRSGSETIDDFGNSIGISQASLALTQNLLPSVNSTLWPSESSVPNGFEPAI